MRLQLAVLAAPLAAMLLGMAACHLVDQRTFERAGMYPGAAQLHANDYAARALPPPPLATVRLGTPGADWQPGLVGAERLALARKPDAQFDLVAPLPSITDPDALRRAGEIGAADAAAVAQVLEEDGVSPDNIHLGARANAGNVPRQIEVYVR